MSGLIWIIEYQHGDKGWVRICIPPFDSLEEWQKCKLSTSELFRAVEYVRQEPSK